MIVRAQLNPDAAELLDMVDKLRWPLEFMGLISPHANRPILEQPVESYLLPMKTVLDFTETMKTCVSLGNYGAETLKPLQIWHVAPEFHAVRTTNECQSSRGVKRFYWVSSHRQN